MPPYHQLKSALAAEPKTWLVTGAAGFIGSNLLEALLRLDQRVVGLDNFATGSRRNLEEVRALVGPAKWKNFRPIKGDIRDEKTCQRASRGVDYILHQAALGSVPRSIANPADSHASNVTGFLNMLVAARDNKIQRFVYASSSSVYGDHPALPKVEENTGRCLSPYAATKRANELYADAFARCYGLECIGLRYFNVFGPRQDPDGPYAAVIPKWISAMIRNQPIQINGDGETSRDFCYVANVVQANLLAATTPCPPSTVHSPLPSLARRTGEGWGEGLPAPCPLLPAPCPPRPLLPAPCSLPSPPPSSCSLQLNIAVHARTTLNQLFALLRKNLLPHYPHLKGFHPVYRDFRPGDVRHSEADITKARRLLGYRPTHTVKQGLAEALDWYRHSLP